MFSIILSSYLTLYKTLEAIILQNKQSQLNKISLRIGDGILKRI